MTIPGALDWHATLVSVTDGDTARLHLERPALVVAGFEVVLRSAGDKGTPIRLVTLDTPERGQPGYAEARWDLKLWAEEHEDELRVETYESAGWDRLLGDLYVAGDRGNTATQHLLRLGWPIYTGKH